MKATKQVESMLIAQAQTTLTRIATARGCRESSRKNLEICDEDVANATRIAQELAAFLESSEVTVDLQPYYAASRSAFHGAVPPPPPPANWFEYFGVARPAAKRGKT